MRPKAKLEQKTKVEIITRFDDLVVSDIFQVVVKI